eukprot:4659156-Prymnesium_polylepis.1
MPECTHAPDSWASAMKEPRDIDNIRATVLRVPVQGTVPIAKAAGDAICGWMVQSSGTHPRRPEAGVRYV